MLVSNQEAQLYKLTASYHEILKNSTAIGTYLLWLRNVIVLCLAIPYLPVAALQLRSNLQARSHLNLGRNHTLYVVLSDSHE